MILSVKFGALRDPAGGFSGIDGRPQAVKDFLAYTLRRSGTGHVDVYCPARLDPDTPIEGTVGAIADMVRAGCVRHIGLSEVGTETIRVAACRATKRVAGGNDLNAGRERLVRPRSASAAPCPADSLAN